MKTNKSRLLFALLLLCASGRFAFAGEKSGEEIKLEASAGELDKKYSAEQRLVAEQLKTQFGVDEGLILGLRYKKIGDGGIGITLALAQELPGGINDENLSKIVALRQGPPVMGWGRIAGHLGLQLGPVIGKLRKISAEVRRQEKADKIKNDKKTESENKTGSGKPGKGVRPERQQETVKAGMKSLSRQ